MPYDQKLDAQRAAMVASLGVGSELLGFPGLSYRWLGAQGFLQPTLPERMAAYARFYEQEATWAEGNMGIPLGPNLATAAYTTTSSFDNVTTPLSATSFSQTAGTTASRSHINFNVVANLKYEVRYTLDSISSGQMAVNARMANGGGSVIESPPDLIGAGSSLRFVFVAPITGPVSVQWIGGTAVSSQMSAISIRQVSS